MVIACQNINGFFPWTTARYNLAQLCFYSRLNVFAGLIVHNVYNTFVQGIVRTDFFPYLAWIFLNKLRGNVDNTLVGSESLGELVFCRNAKLVSEICHD